MPRLSRAHQQAQAFAGQQHGWDVPLQTPGARKEPEGLSCA